MVGGFVARTLVLFISWLQNPLDFIIYIQPEEKEMRRGHTCFFKALARKWSTTLLLTSHWLETSHMATCNGKGDWGMQ